VCACRINENGVIKHKRVCKDGLFFPLMRWNCNGGFKRKNMRKTFKNPVIAASGTFGFGREYAEIYNISHWEEYAQKA
jgi:hypothetical protein